MDRSNALTYSNVKQMCDQVYDCMVNAGVAHITVEYSEDYPGPLKTNYHLTHLEMLLVADELGSTSSLRGDGHIGGQKYLFEQSVVPQIQASHSNEQYFTILGFTSMSAHPVLCLIIIAGVQEIYEIKTVIDIKAEVVMDILQTLTSTFKRIEGRVSCS